MKDSNVQFKTVFSKNNGNVVEVLFGVRKTYLRDQNNVSSREFTIDGHRYRLMMERCSKKRNWEVSVLIESMDGNEHYLEYEIGFVKEQYQWSDSLPFHASCRVSQTKTKAGVEKIPVRDIGKLGYLVNGFIRVRVTMKGSHLDYHVQSSSYNSRCNTGMVGLFNQGATCYLNSLIQTLFHLKYFRKCIYQLEFDENVDKTKEIPYALQRLFARLELSPEAVSTEELTRSFGWGDEATAYQHDVQELFMTLRSCLEEKFKGSVSENLISHLFEGEEKHYCEGISVDFESTRIQKFQDLQLEVSTQNLLASFQKYIAPEILQGENGYRTEKYGIQDIRKGVIFHKLPKVLFIQLMRFQYNVETDALGKINERFEFPTECDFTPYLDSESPQKDTNNKYTLFAVLTHAGSLASGHYYSFALMDILNSSPKWCKFDDNQVYIVPEHVAVNENFGGADQQSFFQSRRSEMSDRSAYMLVYIRNEYISEIMDKSDAMPLPLKQEIQKEIEQENLTQKMKEKEAESVEISIFTWQTLLEHSNHSDFHAESDVKIMLPKSELWIEAKRRIKEFYENPDDWKLYFWVIQERMDGTIRLTQRISNVEHKPLSEIFFHNPKQEGMFRCQLYVEFTKAQDIEHTQLIFFKEFDKIRRNLSFSFRSFVPPEKFSVERSIRKHLEIGNETNISFVEEKGFEPITDFSNQVITGDIFTFSRNASVRDIRKHYHYLRDRVSVIFINLQDQEKKIEMELLTTWTYVELCVHLGEKLKVNPLKLRFQIAKDSEPIKSTKVTNVETMLRTKNNGLHDTIYYETLDVDLSVVENQAELDIYWFDGSSISNKPIRFVIPISSKVEDLIQMIEESLGMDHLRLAYIAKGRIDKYCKKNTKISSLVKSFAGTYPRYFLRAEIDVADEKQYLNFCHFWKPSGVLKTYGNPFRLKVKKHESVKEMKESIQEFLGLTEKEIQKFRIAILAGNKCSPYLRDDDVVWEKYRDLRSSRSKYVGLQHQNPNPDTEDIQVAIKFQ